MPPPLSEDAPPLLSLTCRRSLGPRAATWPQVDLAKLESNFGGNLKLAGHTLRSFNGKLVLEQMADMWQVTGRDRLGPA